jgi:hypothetical protein
MNLNSSVGQYATANGKYLVLRTVGSVGTGMTWDSYTDKGYFIESIGVKVTPQNSARSSTYLPSGWKLDRSTPQNDSDTGSVTTSTGFGFTASNPPAASFSTTTGVSMNVSSWAVTNHNIAPVAQWTWKLSLVGSGTKYNTWGDLRLGDDEWAWEAGLHSLPTISNAGWGTSSSFVALTDAVYLTANRYDNNAMYFNFYFTQTVRETWRSSYTWFTAGYSTRSSTAYRSMNWYFNMAYTQY